MPVKNQCRWLARAFLAFVILTVLSGTAETRSYWRACHNRWVYLIRAIELQP
jgi:hypothetical protein